MAIYLKKQKKLKKANSIHHKTPPSSSSSSSSALTKNPSHRLITNNNTCAKTGINFPKILSMQRRNHRNIDDQTIQKNANVKRDRLEKRRIHLPKTIESIISRACGRNRRPEKLEMHVSNSDEDKKEDGEGEEKHEQAVSDSDSSNGMQEAKSTKQYCTSSNTQCTMTVSSSFSRIFCKSKTFHIKKWKSIEARDDKSKPNVYGRSSSTKVRPKTMDVKQKEKILQEEVKGDGVPDDKSNDELELCKKRILMGEKCRPLNQSGILHYDQDGVLLPEDVPSSEES